MKKVNEIGECLKNARIKKNYSQEQLAEFLCVTRQTISNWEHGKSIPDIEQLEKISDLFPEEFGDSKIKNPTEKKMVYVLVINYIIAILILGVSYKFSGTIPKEILIPIGPPLLISTVVYIVLSNALQTGNYDLIGGYNSKYEYNEKVLRKIIYFILRYILISSMITNFILLTITLLGTYKKYGVLLLYVYIVNFFVGIIFINIRNKNRLFKL